MLTQKTRPYFQTLFDALVLTAEDEAQTAITFVATDQERLWLHAGRLERPFTNTPQQQKNLGIAPGDLVIIAYTQNLEAIYAFWGSMLIGAIPSMFPTLTEKLDPQIYMRDMAKLVQLSEVKAILTSEAFAPVLAENMGCPVHGGFNAEMQPQVGQRRRESISIEPTSPDEIAFFATFEWDDGLEEGGLRFHIRPY